MKGIVLVVLALVVGIMATPANAARPSPVLPPTITEACPWDLGPTYPVSGTAIYSFRKKVKATITTFDVDWMPIDIFNNYSYVATFTTPDLKLDSVTLDLNCVPASGQGVFNWSLAPGGSWIVPQSADPSADLCDPWFEPLESSVILDPDEVPSNVTVELVEPLPGEWSLVLQNPSGFGSFHETGTLHWTCVEIPHVDELHTVQPSVGPEDDVYVGCPEGQTPVEDSLIWESNLGSSTQVIVQFVNAANAFRLRNLGTVEEHIRIQFECAPTNP